MIRQRLKYLMVVIGLCVFCASAFGSVLSDIKVDNSEKKSVVSLHFNGKPDWSWFILHKPERFVLDLQQNGVIKGLPLTFNGTNLVRRIRSSQPPNASTIRLVFELNHASGGQVTAQQSGQQWVVNVTLESQITTPAPSEPKTPFNPQASQQVTNANTTTYPGGNP